MMKKAVLLIVALVAVALAHAYALARPSQVSLVEAWEKVQRDDPEAVTFEKVGEHRYKFKTDRFPFDGELRILKATVDDSMADSEFGIVLGVIEFDLVGLSEEVVRKYQHSYSDWERTNTLYLDRDTGSWLSSDEHMAKLRAKARELSREPGQTEMRGPAAMAVPTEYRSQATALWLTLSATWLPVLLLIALWAWIFKGSGFNRQRDYMNHAITHMQNVEGLLERMTVAMEKGGKPRQD